MLGRTLDELPPHTRKLLNMIHAMVKTECERSGIEQKHYRFSRRQVREHTGWGNTQVKVHLARLEDMEYVIPHGGSRGKLIAYELQYRGEGEDAKPFLMGLIDIDELKRDSYDKKKSGVNDERSGSSRPQVGGRSGTGRGNENEESLGKNSSNQKNDLTSPENAHPEAHTPNRNRTITSLAAIAATVER